MIYICSPFSGDMEANRKKAIEYCKYAIKCGVTPVAPHLLFPQFLDDAVPKERELGMKMGLEILDHCEELWVMSDVMSDGMKTEIEYAMLQHIRVKYITDSDMEETIKMEGLI